jgi:hypothetical protein
MQPGLLGVASLLVCVPGGALKTAVFDRDMAWDAALSGDEPTDSLRITVTGDSVDAVRWTAVVRSVE